MMTDNLVIECKKGLGMSLEPDEAIDGVINQKLLTVQAFMVGAGVPATNLESDLAVGVIVLGVTDLWNLNSGEVKFSPVFFTLVTQLAVG